MCFSACYGNLASLHPSGLQLRYKFIHSGFCRCNSFSNLQVLAATLIQRLQSLLVLGDLLLAGVDALLGGFVAWAWSDSGLAGGEVVERVVRSSCELLLLLLLLKVRRDILFNVLTVGHLGIVVRAGGSEDLG